MSDFDMIRELRRNDERLRLTEVKEVPRYATGTFTPELKGNITPGSWTYNVQTGFYTRIGNRVFFNLSVNAATRPGAPTGIAIIDGLPFTSVSTANSHSPCSIDTLDAITLSATNNMLTARVPPNTTFIEFIEVLATSPTTTNGLAATGWSATAFVRVSGHYIIA